MMEYIYQNRVAKDAEAPLTSQHYTLQNLWNPLTNKLGECSCFWQSVRDRHSNVNIQSLPSTHTKKTLLSSVCLTLLYWPQMFNALAHPANRHHGDLWCIKWHILNRLEAVSSMGTHIITKKMTLAHNAFIVASAEKCRLQAALYNCVWYQRLPNIHTTQSQSNSKQLQEKTKFHLLCTILLQYIASGDNFDCSQYMVPVSKLAWYYSATSSIQAIFAAKPKPYSPLVTMSTLQHRAISHLDRSCHCQMQMHEAPQWRRGYVCQARTQDWRTTPSKWIVPHNLRMHTNTPLTSNVFQLS